MKFGTQIKMRRKQLRLTQAEVANQLYITRQTISNWEQGKSYPDLNTLVRLSDLYQISIDSLLKEDTELKNYLEQGKAYNAFSVLRGLITMIEQVSLKSILLSMICTTVGFTISITSLLMKLWNALRRINNGKVSI